MNMTDKPLHEGRNVKRLREILGMKQDTLALELGLSQQAISQLEQKEALDKELLEKIAAVLKIPVEAIKNFDEEKAINIISNTFNDQAVNMNYQCNFNPLEKFIEQVEKNEKLYEALLQSEREKVELLKKMVEKGDS
jgi:transcriptional regulator with XRE-family HTH domain